MERESLRKINVKTVMGGNITTGKNAAENAKQVEKILDGTKQKFIMVIAGFCNGEIKTGESAFGQWTAFRGEFLARRIEDGEEFVSNLLMVPEPLFGMLQNEVSKIGKANGPEEVQFAYRIGIKMGATAQGYEYVCEPIKAIQSEDRLSGLLSPMAEPKQIEKKGGAK